jgi:hypothetical protein
MNLADGTRSSLQQVAEVLAQAWQIPLEVATSDVRDLYDQLIEQLDCRTSLIPIGKGWQYHDRCFFPHTIPL